MKGDLHIHSRYSPDSRSEPEQIVRMAKAKGLDFIAISDHNRFVQHELDFLVINGEEVSTVDGHVLAVFINGEIPSGLSQEETVEAIHNKNGIAICAHPFRSVNGIGSKFKNVYDAIEGKNGRCREECNIRGQMLATDLKRPITAGSDSHFYDEVGRVYLEVEATDEESIRKAIISGNTRTGGYDLTAMGQVKLYLKLGKDYTARGFKRI